MHQYGILLTAPIIFTGTVNLLNDIKGWLIVLITVATIVVLLKEGFVWYQADEQTRPGIVKKMKQTAYIGILLCCVSGLVPWLFSYYTNQTP